MKNNIKVFDFKSSTGELLSSVRSVVIDSTPWFFAVDICNALGLTNTAISLQSIDDEDKTEYKDYLGSGRKPLLVNESGLYALIIKSRKKQARRFKRWITSEVIPSIRKTGNYSLTTMTSLPDFSDPAAAARAWADEYEAKNRAISYVHRQAQYIEHLENLFQPGMTPVQFCKQLNGVNVQRITAFLEAHNWLYDERPESRSPAWRVKAYARDLYLTERHHYIDSGYEEGFYSYTPVLLQKGAVWIYRQYLRGALPMKRNWNGEFTHDKELAGAA
ncbi:transporter [Escherichia coli]|uniref:Transporter n=2 Tax=Escherichia coli TaxID=562 RepID=A0A2A2BX11_ECOLX|nr:BRO family protein [Escherichia coli]EEV2832052.1 transporter [Escherichia coli O91:H21]EHY2133870.1 transporter [Escherichia coli O157]EKK3486225.1 transporter [Escherichia coli O8]ELO0553156.1 transporter [Escherichia coli O91]ELQ0209424.1 transporter [Escherichia coli O178]EMA1621248.1 transporter [Escherichia coli O103]HDQ6529694.1 transporter [Escherichia coli O75:H8]HDQ6580169.1 transporter [Escherichia coli O146:H21]HDQ6701420.1 transporter [Escherichia coli O174:H8]HDQ6873471.1